MHQRPTRRVVVALGAAALLFAACGSDDNDAAVDPTTAATDAPAATHASVPTDAAETTDAVLERRPWWSLSTSWVAVIAEMAGATDVAYIAPNNVQHPPDYEPTASDLAAVPADADYVLMAGFEGFAETLTEASGSDEQVVTVMTSYDPAMLWSEVEKLAAGAPRMPQRRTSTPTTRATWRRPRSCRPCRVSTSTSSSPRRSPSSGPPWPAWRSWARTPDAGDAERGCRPRRTRAHARVRQRAHGRRRRGRGSGRGHARRAGQLPGR